MKSIIIKLVLANLIAFLLYFIYLQFQAKPAIEDNNPKTKVERLPTIIPSIIPSENSVSKTEDDKAVQSNASEYAYPIKAAFVSANNYINNSVYDPTTHTEIMSQLLFLYDIKGLTNEQNKLLEETIMKMKRKEQKTFKPLPKNPKTENSSLQTTKPRELIDEKTAEKPKDEKVIENKVKKNIIDYEVKEEDKSMYSIKEKYKMSIERLREINPSIKEDKIKVGQIIKVEADENQ